MEFLEKRKICLGPDLNQGPPDWESNAVPTELIWVADVGRLKHDMDKVISEVTLDLIYFEILILGAKTPSHSLE